MKIHLIVVIYELQKYIKILFEAQKESNEYKAIMRDLNSISSDTRAIASTVGGINTPEKFAEIHPYAQEVLDILIRYVPKLLEEETFFSNVFYQ